MLGPAKEDDGTERGSGSQYLDPYNPRNEYSVRFKKNCPGTYASTEWRSEFFDAEWSELTSWMLSKPRSLIAIDWRQRRKRGIVPSVRKESAKNDRQRGTHWDFGDVGPVIIGMQTSMCLLDSFLCQSSTPRLLLHFFCSTKELKKL